MEIDYSNAGFWALMAATFVLATTHSVNPDHWFPFVMVGRAKRWKTSWVLALACIAGIGHVGTSVVIGLTGVFAKKGTAKEIAVFLENATPLLLMIFGFGYAAYHLYKHRVGSHGHSHGLPFINKLLGIDPHAYDIHHHDHGHSQHEEQDHQHDHAQDLLPRAGHKQGVNIGKINLYLHNMDLHISIAHDDHTHDYDATVESDHTHPHSHFGNTHTHEHIHEVKGKPISPHRHGNHEHTHGIDLKDKKAGWGLVAILGLTPCIALLPMTFAAVKYGTTAIILVNINFALATIGTILLFTWLGYLGLSWVKLEFFDEYGDIIAGVIIGLVGVLTRVFAL
jgi:ABC-type nickel/cobalt efflux system permease component RcnA